MAIVRDVSPLPPGRYWIIVNQPNIADFDAWIRDMAGAVQIETAELDSRRPASQFLIFRVPAGRMPFLSAEQFGFPNTAGPEVTTRADVVANPQTPNPEDQAVDVIHRGSEAAANFASAGPLLALLVLFALRR